MFQSKPGSLTSIKVYCNSGMTFTFYFGDPEHHELVRNVKICEIPSEEEWKQITTCHRIAIAIYTRNRPRLDQHIMHIKQHILKQHLALSLPKHKRYSGEHLILKNTEVGQKSREWVVSLWNKSVVIYQVDTQPGKYMNLTMDAIGSSLYATDMCSVIGFSVYDGGNTMSSMIGPYCGAFGLDDPFQKTPVQV